MGIFNGIKAGGDVTFSNINIGGSKSVLDQIDEIIKKEIKSIDSNLEILDYSGSKYLYCLEIECEGVKLFKTKKEMVDWLNKNGWKIYTENKS